MSKKAGMTRHSHLRTIAAVLVQLALLAGGSTAFGQTSRENGGSPASFETAFDALWADMDRNYSYFSLKKIDWKALREQYRPRAATAKSQKEFVEVLKQMLTQLKDMHIWIETPDGTVGTYGVQYRRNWNPKTITDALVDQIRIGEFAIVGKTKADGFGVLILTNQGKAAEQNVAETVKAMQALKDTPGFVVDLRSGASGGSEPLAKQIARFFCAKDAVYAKSKYRSGPGHEEFTADYPRVLEAGEDPYTQPVVCLIGHRCMSSGEAFVQMMECLPHVTTIGDKTRGASGNPKAFPLPGSPISVWYSRWVDMMPDGTAVEGVGITPKIRMALPTQAFQAADPVWNRGLQVLRQKTAATATQAGGQAKE